VRSPGCIAQWVLCLSREKSAHQHADEELGEQVEQIFKDSRQTYGSPRIERALREQGVRTSRKRVSRLMRTRGLRSVRARKRRQSLTKAGQQAYIVPNLLAQDFTATRRNEKWVTDTTYIPTREGWLYLVSVMDLYNRKVVGWAMGEQHDAALSTAALDMAIRRERPQPGLIVHSDRGSEFANTRFHQRAAEAQLRLSMSSTGNCYDNASAESLFATVKLEAIRGRVFASRLEARQELFDFIEVFYNQHRLHSGIDYARPVSWTN
jgi:transposase InsO family protein